MNKTLAPCRNCGEEILAGTYECPHCELSTADHNRRRLYLGAAGIVLTLSIVLAPLGLPMLWLAHRHRQLAEVTVTERPRTRLIPHLRRVLHRQLDLDYSFQPRAEFTRGSSGGNREFRSPPRL